MDNAANSPQSLTMTGNGVTTGTSGAASVTETIYGVQALGTTSQEQQISFSNTGNTALTLSSVTITGADSADFAISTNQCGTPVALQVGQQCYVGVTFTPRAAGQRLAYLNFNDNAANSPQKVLLSGTTAGMTKSLLLSTPALFFGGQFVGTGTPLLPSVVISNAGTETVHIKSVTVTGASAGDFTIGYEGCMGALTGGATCSLVVNFNPTAVGNRTATIEITNDSGQSPLRVSLSGVGTTESIGLDVVPANLTFSEAVGTTSSAQSITLFNTGAEGISLSSIAITGPTDYSISSNSCV